MRFLLFIFLAGVSWRLEAFSKKTSSSSSSSSSVTSTVSNPSSSAGSSLGNAGGAVTTAPNWVACRVPILNRGSPPVSFLNELLAWAKGASDEIFLPNSFSNEIYPRLQSKLGPLPALKQRKAALLDLMVVSAAMESSFNFNEGRDLSANNTSDCTAEAGVFQTSGNVLTNFGGDLKTLFTSMCSASAGNNDCQKFQSCSKSNHVFAFETHARLLRHANGYSHYGPILSGKVQSYLSRDCAKEFEAAL